MPDIASLSLFFGAALVLLITPGPAVMYIIARGVDQGRTAGVVSALGMGVGTLFHVVAAALGLSALLVSSALAFSVVKYAGAVYLVYLGVRHFVDAGHAPAIAAPETRSLRRIFSQSVLVNVLNPKTALFFLAFLPQFVDLSAGNVPLQFLALGLAFVLLGLVSDSSYGLLAGTAGGWLRRNAGLLRAQRYFAGGVYITLGLFTAFSGANNK